MVPGRPARSRSDRSERVDAGADLEQLAQREPFWAEVDSEVLGETTWVTSGRLTFGPSTESSTDSLETLGRLEILTAEPIDGRSDPERAPLGRAEAPRHRGGGGGPSHWPGASAEAQQLYRLGAQRG